MPGFAIDVCSLLGFALDILGTLGFAIAACSLLGFTIAICSEPHPTIVANSVLAFAVDASAVAGAFVAKSAHGFAVFFAANGSIIAASIAPDLCDACGLAVCAASRAPALDATGAFVSARIVCGFRVPRVCSAPGADKARGIIALYDCTLAASAAFRACGVDGACSLACTSRECDFFTTYGAFSVAFDS